MAFGMLSLEATAERMRGISTVQAARATINRPETHRAARLEGLGEHVAHAIEDRPTMAEAVETRVRAVCAQTT